ncbi:hypothetical protein B0H14DRAFT_299054 [Mycena olivaceomarginata]|nr:hypothetical protein B0H14DRAFT_299054 [Mycena olivaceomarginata]
MDWMYWIGCAGTSTWISSRVFFPNTVPSPAPTPLSRMAVRAAGRVYCPSGARTAIWARSSSWVCGYAVKRRTRRRAPRTASGGCWRSTCSHRLLPLVRKKSSKTPAPTATSSARPAILRPRPSARPAAPFRPSTSSTPMARTSPPSSPSPSAAPSEHTPPMTTTPPPRPPPPLSQRQRTNGSRTRHKLSWMSLRTPTWPRLCARIRSRICST